MQTMCSEEDYIQLMGNRSEGKLIDIEMQLFNKYDIEKRTMFYWSKRYASQLSQGDKYPELRKCVTINILNYTFLKNEQYHNVFHLREDRTGISLIDDIEVHFLELPKLDEHSVPSEGGVINWLLFLKGADTSQWEVLKINEPGLEKAMDTLQYLSQDSEARRLYEARQKYLHDEASMLGSAEMAGVKKVAKNMLDLNLDIPIIVKATGLTEQGINALRK